MLFLASTNLAAQNGLDFDGGNDVVQTNYSGVLGDTNRTFEAWIKVSTAAPSSNLCIVDYGINQVGSRNTFLVDGNRGLRFVSGGTNANIASSNSGIITPGQWTHVAFVLDNGTGFLFVDGIEVGSGNLTTVNTPANGANLSIGERVAGSSIPFEGVIDEVRIWDVALDTTQIRANINNTICNYPGNLKAYFPLDDGIAGGNNSNITSTENKISMNLATLTGFALTGSNSNWVLGAPVTGGNTFDTLTVTDCTSFLSPSGKYTYTASGTYSDTIPNSLGCDSILSINLSLVNNPTFFTLTIDTCSAYTVPSGKRTLTQSGSYLDTIPNAQNCDSIIAINLTVTIISTVVGQTGNNRLTATETGASYQWLDCGNGFTTLVNDTNRFYDPTYSGSFAVQITKNGCIDTSSCITVTGVGIEESAIKSKFYLANNPTRDFLQLHHSAGLNFTSSIYGLNGKAVSFSQKKSDSMTQYDLSNLPAGVYILMLENRSGSIERFKIVKQ